MSVEAEVAKIVERNARTRLVAAQAAGNDPNNPLTQAAVANAYALTGEHDLALKHYQRAATLAPDNSAILLALGQAQQNLGEISAAAQSFRRAIALDGNNISALYALTQVEKQTFSNNWINQLEKLFAAPDPDGMRTLHAGHALAKTYEDFGELEKSFDWLGRGKAIRSRMRPYAFEEGRRVAEAAMALTNGAATGDPSEEPIFIVGLPRTGTSLVDRILSSHPGVVSAGELNNLPQLIKAMTQTPGDQSLDVATLRAADKLDFARLGAAFVASTRPVTGERSRFIDKAPIHYLLAGAIHRALPNARIICLSRDPMDAVLSLYRQMFPTDKPYYDFVYRLADTARAYALYRRVADHLRATLPADRYTEVRYESVVENLEGEARRLVAFCGLDWDDRCLSFHENRSAISTPSSAQVRQPLYASSVGRWRKYGALMQPAREALAREGIEAGA